MYALRYREELAPAVVKEMDDFISFLQHYLAVSLNEDGSLRLATPSGAGASKNTVSITDAIEAEEGHWWKKGPWIFDTDHSHEAMLVTPTLAAATINDFAPAGIDTAIGVEFNLSGDITITGIKAPPRAYRRIVVLRNNSATKTITLKHNSSSSQPLNRFQLPGSVDIVMGTRQTAWLYYDADNHNWGSFITGNTSGGLFGAGSSSTGGDVVGPASAVDNNIAVFNGTTGKLIKDGGSTIAAITAGAGLFSVSGSLGDMTTVTTPITLAAAPGAGYIVVPHSFHFYQAMGTATFNVNPNLNIRYNGTTTTLFGNTTASNAANRFLGFWQRALSGNSGVDVDPRNRAIELFGDNNATYNAGTHGAFSYGVTYSIVAL